MKFDCVMCIEIETSKLCLIFDKNIVENLKYLENKIILPTKCHSHTTIQTAASKSIILFLNTNFHCLIVQLWQKWLNNKSNGRFGVGIKTFYLNFTIKSRGFPHFNSVDNLDLILLFVKKWIISLPPGFDCIVKRPNF